MDQSQKDALRGSTEKHIAVVQEHVDAERTHILQQTEQLTEIVQGAAEKGSHDEESTDLEQILLSEKGDRVDELLALHDSPYFTKCVVRFDRESEDKVIYFGKFAFFLDAISSWTTPIAQLRFETPGRFVLKNFEGEEIRGELKYKEQYMIVDGHVVFMAAEGMNQARELVYQERLMRKKSDFSLPEIVEQMEKAQDEVIRAHWKGSFLISGPAGSGKTTLALHRVAYLAQAPETEVLFPAEKIIVFVQDASTKAYFSNLLPELGIKRVLITTFDEWLIEQLGLNGFKFVRGFGDVVSEYDKNLSLQRADWEKIEKVELTKKNTWDLLSVVYGAPLTEQLAMQKRELLLDRFDLAVLGMYAMKKLGGLTTEIAQYEHIRRLEYKKNLKRIPLTYSLIIVDEAENFLSEQISIILSTLSKKTEAVLYVGDLAQQTLPYTIRDWNAVGESFGEGRKVVLQKVYRNTKQILEYIRSAGFDVVIPNELATGKEVCEFVCEEEEELENVAGMIRASDAGVIGILARDEDCLEWYRAEFAKDLRVKIMTINEAQGVEFDAVYLVGVDRETYVPDRTNSKYYNEYRKVNHDLLYVALTRAMNELNVFGRVKLVEIVKLLS